MSQYKDNLFRAILSLKTPEECDAFFSDLCTVREVADLSARLEVARLLSIGTNYTDIGNITGASSATISRVSKCLAGKTGGYRLVLDALKEGVDRGEESELKVAFTECAYNRVFSSDLEKLGLPVAKEGDKPAIFQPRDIQNLIEVGAFDFAFIAAHEIPDPKGLVTLAEIGEPLELALAFSDRSEKRGSLDFSVATPYPEYSKRVLPSSKVTESYDTRSAVAYSLADAALDFADNLAGLVTVKTFKSPILLVASRKAVGTSFEKIKSPNK